MLWTSHRGLQSAFTENTLEAFQAAVEQGCTSLETDLHCTADKKIVLHHDSMLERICGEKKQIEQISYLEYSRMRTLHDRLSLPCLDELYENFSEQNWIFDIKAESALETLDQLKIWADTPRKRDWIDNKLRFLHWSRSATLKSRELFNRVECLSDQWSCYQAGISFLLGLDLLSGVQKKRTYSLPRYFKGIDLYTEKMIKKYKSKGAQLICYLPSKQTDIERAKSLGICEVLSDFKPDYL